MAIIYSYPTVVPTSDDLVLGTDVNGTGQPTKNFTIQSIVDIVAGGAAGLGAVLAISSDALQQSATNFVNIQGTGTSTFSTFTDGTMSIIGGVGTGFSSFASTSFTGKLDANSFNQDNVRTLGILTGLQIANATPNVNLIDTIITAPGLDTSLVTEKAVVDYVATNPTSETLAEVLANGNESGGVNSIDMTGAISNVTFIDSIDPANPTSKAQGRATFGTGNDLQIYFDGTSGYIDQTNNSNLIISGTEVKIQNGGLANTEDMIKAVSDGEVILYHNGTDKIQTSSTGVTVNGVIQASVGAVNGASYSFTGTANTGMYSPATNEIEFVTNGAARLKISGDGINVTGVTESDSFTTDTTLSKTQMTRFVKSTDPSNPVTTPATAGIFAANLQVDTMIPTVLAVKNYADGAAAASTLTYQGDLNAAEPLNLATDTFLIDGGSNINTSTVAVTGNVGSVVVNLDNAVTITGKMQAGTLSDGTFSGTAGTYTGGVSITSTDFIGNLTGNVTGNVSGSAGSLATPGTIQLLAGSGATLGVTSNALTYTSGGDVQLITNLASTTVTGKVLTGLSVPSTGNSIEPDDSILNAFGKLQAQHNTSVNGLRYIGTWDARTQAEGGSAGDRGFPALPDGGGVITTGANTSVVADQLVDTTFGTDFASAGVTAGDRVYNQAGAFTTVSSSAGSVTATVLVLNEDIFLTSTQTYSIDDNPALNQGEYYVVNQPGTVNLNGIASWAVGDWVIAGAGNTWEKLDQTGVDGTGSIGRISRWDTVSSLNDSIILQDNDGIKIDSGKKLTTQGTGGDLLVGGAATISGLTTAGAALSLTGGVNLPTGAYGTVGQVLTNDASPGATTNLIWRTPIENNDFLTGLAFNTTDGVLTATVSNQSDVTVDLDGRYFLSTGGTISGAVKIEADLDMDGNKIEEVDELKFTNNKYIYGTGGAVKVAGQLRVDDESYFNNAVFLDYIENATVDTDRFLVSDSDEDGEIKYRTGAQLRSDIGAGEITAVTVTAPITGGGTSGSIGIGIDTMGVASAGAGGTKGAVPASNQGDQLKFLRADATWVIPTDLKGVETVNTTSPIEGGGTGTSVTITHKAVLTDAGGNVGTYDSVTVDGNGHVTGGTNPGGDNAGMFSGSKSFTGGAAAATLFRLTRTTTGALIFDVYLTSATSGYSCKKYTVAHILNTGPTYNKIIDSGAAANGDYVVTFTNDGQGVGGDTVKCEIAATTSQDIHYTIQVGQGATAVTRYTS